MKTSNTCRVPPRHLFPPFRHLISKKLVPAGSSFLVMAMLLTPVGGRAYASQKKTKTEAYLSEFLMFGTVFTEQGFALPGAQVKIRRTSDRKAKWGGYSDSRGVFAIRVPKGNEYEVGITAKGFAPATRTVDARSADHEDMVFRMQPTSEGKKK
jgi:hypothetical protein